MKKIASLTGILLVLMAGASFAGGMNLSWDGCGAAGVSDKTFVCNGASNQTMVGSFILSSILNVTSTTNQVDIAVDAVTMPTFWALGNSTSTLGPRFIMGDNFVGVGACGTWATEPAVDANAHTTSGNKIRLKVAPFIGSPGFDISPGVETLAFTLQVVDNNAVGCATPACIRLNEVFVEDAFGIQGVEEHIVTTATRSHVTWQGGGALSCPLATPTQAKTWGSIKALYR